MSRMDLGWYFEQDFSFAMNFQNYHHAMQTQYWCLNIELSDNMVTDSGVSHSAA